MKWLAGYDFSSCADAAVEFAAKEVASSGAADATLVLVHAYREPDKHVGFDLALASSALKPLEDLTAILEETIRKRLDEVAERLKTRHVGLKVQTIAARGHAPEAIVETADALEADCIVVGTHGHRGLTKFFLGSVTERVLKMTHRPVLVVKEPPTE